MTLSHAAHRFPQPIEPKAGLREWCALATLMIPVLLVSIDNTVLSFALPAISTALAPTGNQLMWVVDIYALMLAGLLISMGSLGDRVGRRRLLIIGSAAFGAASVLAAFSTSPEMLIAGRMLLGIAGATLMPSTLSLIRNIFIDRDQRRIAIAAWAAMFAGGAALGPVVGGWLLQHFWWGSVFLINVPLIVLFLALAVWLVPESKDPAPGPVDPRSILLSLVAMFPAVYAIKKFASAGLGPVVVVSAAVAVVAGVVFVRRQRRIDHPMIDVSLFADRVFSGAVLANMLSLLGFAGFLFFGAQYLQLVLGLEPMHAAFVLLPGLAATITAGFTVVKIVRYVPVHIVVATAFGLSATGFAVTAFVAEAPSVVAIASAFVLLAVGIGFAETLTNDLILSCVPPNRAGAASAISETAYEIGAVMGTAVLGSILLAVYRSELQIPVVIGDKGLRAQSTETLGGAVDAAQAQGGVVGDQLVAAAQAAFMSGVQVTSIVAVVLALAAALVSFRALRPAAR